MSEILIVDDEASICWALSEALKDEGHAVCSASSAEEGLEAARARRFDAVVLDVRLPGLDGLAAMGVFRDQTPGAPIIMITAFGSLETAVRAVAAGAHDYMVKPFELDHAVAVITRALETPAPVPATATAPREPEPTLLGHSQAMQQLYRAIALVAPTEVSVLITGESGTGKELVARAIHRHGPRKNGPFAPVCLSALNPSLVESELFGHVRGAFTGAGGDRKGLLELAAGGTVLLDEIGDVPANLQVKLLRALEQREAAAVGEARPRPLDIRVLAATNRPLQELMAAGAFREDLFFRLGVFQIHIPPLRDRRDDIPDLAQHFLSRFQGTGVHGVLSEAVFQELQARPWAGNVRELRNTIEHAAIVARGRAIQPADLPPPQPRPNAQASTEARIQEQLAAWTRQALATPLVEPERSLSERFLELTEPPLLRAALEDRGGNRASAARILGIHRGTLREKLRKYGIE